MTRFTVCRGGLALGACVAAVALLAGCGAQPAGGRSAPESGSPITGKAVVDIARDAPDVTRAAGSSGYAVEMTYSTSGGPIGAMAFSMSGTGTYDFARQIGDGEYTATGDGSGLPAQEVVFRNNVLYQRDAGASRWQEIDYSAQVRTPIGQQDPGGQLELLRGVSDDVREVGSAQVRGEEVTRYAITIDPRRLAAESGVVVEGGLTQMALQAAGPIPGQVFVDSDGRVRRLEVRIEVAGADLAASPELGELLGDAPGVQELLRDRRTESDISIEYFDFGVPVTAQVPDPSTVDAGPVLPLPR
jgi:hypothetical protein